MDANAPLANEKARTPVTIMAAQKILSVELTLDTSPYPTVVKVYTAQ
jgi:hypothetical protein